MTLIFFIIGIFVGTFIGIFVMCLCRISAEADKQQVDLTQRHKFKKTSFPSITLLYGERMQNTGYLNINNQIILILVRQKQFSRALKLRKTGKPGQYFVDESIFLKDEPVLLKQLLKGKVISV